MPEPDSCKATIVFGDDYGDNSSTFHCQLTAGHNGHHQEQGDMGWDGVYFLPYILYWQGSDAEFDTAMARQREVEVPDAHENHQD